MLATANNLPRPWPSRCLFEGARRFFLVVSLDPFSACRSTGAAGWRRNWWWLRHGALGQVWAACGLAHYKWLLHEIDPHARGSSAKANKSRLRLATPPRVVCAACASLSAPAANWPELNRDRPRWERRGPPTSRPSSRFHYTSRTPNNAAQPFAAGNGQLLTAPPENTPPNCNQPERGLLHHIWMFLIRDEFGWSQICATGLLYGSTRLLHAFACTIILSVDFHIYFLVTCCHLSSSHS
jgi:hypothetical protein